MINWSHDFFWGEKRQHLGLCLADTTALSMFNIELERGEIATALDGPDKAVITRQGAKRMFGDEDPVGQVITTSSRYFAGDYTITGVVADIPRNSHLHFHLFTGHPSTGSPNGWRRSWSRWRIESTWRPGNVFIRLSSADRKGAVEKTLEKVVITSAGPDYAALNTYELQPINRNRLYSKSDYGLWSSGDINYIYRLVTIGFLTLLIACMNYANLATARAARRAREVGARKALGAEGRDLAAQFMSEAWLLVTLSTLFGVLVAYLAMPVFTAYVNVGLTFDAMGHPAAILALVVLTLLMTFGSGAYPALVLARFRPAVVLKQQSFGAVGGAAFRRSLVFFQYAIAICLISTTVVIHRQNTFLHERELGFDKSQMLMVPLMMQNYDLQDRRETIRQALLNHPNVIDATTCWPHPGRGGERQVVEPEGTGGEEWQMQVLGVDENFIPTFDMKMKAGRNLVPGDSTNVFILNETAVKQLGWSAGDAVGRSFRWRRKVVGVVEDFHTESLHSAVQPVFLSKWMALYVAVRIAPTGVAETIAHVEDVWRQFLPKLPPEHYFLDEQIQRKYWTEERLFRSIGVFSALAIIVSCMGLTGLVAYLAERRKREMGIRKVVGASRFSLVGVLSGESIKLALLANVVAWPVAFFAVRSWLDDFAYRIEPSLWMFVASSILTLALSQLAVGFQAWRATAADPVEVLRQD